MAQQIAPPAKGMTARDYYNQLTSQGMRPYDAYKAVEASFGSPPSPQQQAADQAAADQKAGLAQTGGTIGGLLLGQEAARGFPNVAGLFGNGAGAGAAEMPGALGGEAALGGTAGEVATPTLLGAQTTAPLAGGAGAGTSGFALEGIGSAGNYYLPIAGAVGMTDLLAKRRNNKTGYLEGAASGAAMGSYFGPWGAAIGAGVGLGAAGLSGAFTSGKSKPQQNRDMLRKDLQDAGIANDNFEVTLAKGDKYNIGKDGKATLTNIDGKTTRRTWDVDWDNPLAKYAVDKIDPRVRSVYKDGKNLEQFTGMLVNAATSNAKNEKEVQANIDAMLGKSGLDKGSGATISPKAPAPNPPMTGPEGFRQAEIQQRPKNMSIRDMLNINANK